MWMALRPQRSQAFECSKGKEFPLEVKQLASRLRIAGHRECVLAFPPQKIDRGNASTETILGIPSLFAIVKMSNHRFYDHHPWKRWSVSCCSYRYVLGISPESMWPLNKSRFELKWSPFAPAFAWLHHSAWVSKRLKPDERVALHPWGLWNSNELFGTFCSSWFSTAEEVAKPTDISSLEVCHDAAFQWYQWPYIIT